MARFSYKPDGETLRAFMRDDSFFRGLRGPVGSGKSVCCCVEVFRRALAQAPGPDGKRKSRWAVIRNTNPQLKTTTIKTWLDWFPEDVFGRFSWSPPFTHHIRKGDLDMEVIFLALDSPEDVKKLLSLELTGAFINEAREVPKSIIDACTMRVGRYPSQRDGGPTWSGVIADTNAPDEDHWWPIMAGDVPPPDHMTREEVLTLITPQGWRFFTQPSAMREERDRDGNVSGYKDNPERENAKGLKPVYYEQIIQGKAKAWIDVYVMNRYGALMDGKQVYPQFSDDLHVAKEKLLPAPGSPIFIGIDFGLTPSAIFGQLVRGQWRILHELVAQDMGIVRFSELLRQDMASKFPGYEFRVWGDPAGDFRAQTDETTPFQILRAAKIIAYPAPSNDVALRIEAVASALNRLVDKQPAFLVDPSCVNLLKGFRGGYCYRRYYATGGERYDTKPDKNKYSHPHDALQYLLMGAGEGRSLTRTGQNTDTRVMSREWDVFARSPRERRRA